MSSPKSDKRDYSETLFLPQTDFPMRAGLPQREPEILKRWEAGDLYKQLRAAAKGREKFILHDGPPYANGNIHIGHALNKILKDVVTRSQQMLGYDFNYVPGWDCHGLPIEWKIEEENYRSKNKPKPDFSDPAALVEFRQECRAFAENWIGVQREEFKRLGVEGDWAHPYTTMDNFAEAQIARELMKFAANGTLYRGSQAGDVERGGEDRAGGSRGRVRGLHQRYGVGEVSGATVGRPIGRQVTSLVGRRQWNFCSTMRQLSSGRRRLGHFPAIERSLSRRRSNTVFMKLPMRPTEIGPKTATTLSWPTNWPATF